MIKKTEKQKVTKAEASDVLEAIGQESEKEGIKWTKYFMDKWDKKTWEENQFKQEKLKKKRRNKMEYYRALSGMLNEEANDMDIPLGYSIASLFSGDGVILKLTDRWGKKYYRAFKPDGTPSIDFVVIVNLLIDMQNTIDLLEYQAEQQLPQSSGLILT